MATTQAEQRTMEEGKNYQTADRICCAVLVLCYLALGIFSRLYTIYPVDDDWSYIRAAQTFFQTGQLKFTPWTSPSLVFQILWGTLFCLLLGFSANSLIVSTLAINGIGMIFFYGLLRETGREPGSALLLCFLVLFNPFSFPLLFTYFTDQHFLGLMLAALFFYYRGAQRESIAGFLIGSVFTTLAVLVRQQGLLIAAAAALYAVTGSRQRGRAALQAVSALALPVTVFALYSYWFNTVHGPTYSSLQQWQWMMEDVKTPLRLFAKTLHRPLLILEFLGVSLIPFSLALLPAPAGWLRRRQTRLLLLFCTAGVLLYLLEHAGSYSSVYTWMNGFHFAYVSEYGYRGAEHVLQLFYKIIDLLAIFSILVLIAELLQERKKTAARAAAQAGGLFLAMGALQVLYLMVVRYKFTRYYLVLIPFFVLWVLQRLPGRGLQKKYFIPLLAFFIAVSVTGTQDFLSFNQARWQLGERLLARGIPPRALSAGFPFDCWHNMDYCSAHPAEIVPQKYDIPWWFEELLPAMDARYLVSASPVPTGFYYLNYFCTDRYTVIDSADYYSALYLKKLRLCVLRREAPAAPDKKGGVYYNFIDNFSGAQLSCSAMPATGSIRAVSPAAGSGSGGRVLLQPAQTCATFRLYLPNRPCRLRFSLKTKESGALFKLYLSNNLLENLFDAPRMLGEEEQMSFVKPRGNLLKPRILYLHYLPPQCTAVDGGRDEITLDMSRFSGMTVDIAFVIEPGPLRQTLPVMGMWGEPVIETY